VKEEAKKEAPKKEEKAEEVRNFCIFLFYFAADFSLLQSILLRPSGVFILGRLVSLNFCGGRLFRKVSSRIGLTEYLTDVTFRTKCHKLILSVHDSVRKLANCNCIILFKK